MKLAKRGLLAINRVTLSISISALACAIGSQNVYAQSYALTPAPTHLGNDDDGVDLINGTFNSTVANVVIGDPANGGIAFTRTLSNGAMYDNVIGLISVSASTVSVTIGGSSETFSLSGSTYTPNQATGSKLASSGVGYYTYTSADGVIRQFVPLSSISNSQSLNYYMSGAGIMGQNPSIMSTITRPNQLVLTFSFSSMPYTGLFGNRHANLIHLLGVTSSAGYSMGFSYAAGDASGWITSITTYNSVTTVPVLL